MALDKMFKVSLGVHRKDELTIKVADIEVFHNFRTGKQLTFDLGTKPVTLQGTGNLDCRAWKGAGMHSICARSMQGYGTERQRCSAVWPGHQSAD